MLAKIWFITPSFILEAAFFLALYPQTLAHQLKLVMSLSWQGHCGKGVIIITSHILDLSSILRLRSARSFMFFDVSVLWLLQVPPIVQIHANKWTAPRWECVHEWCGVYSTSHPVCPRIMKGLHWRPCMIQVWCLMGVKCRYGSDSACELTNIQQYPTCVIKQWGKKSELFGDVSAGNFTHIRCETWGQQKKHWKLENSDNIWPHLSKRCLNTIIRGLKRFHTKQRRRIRAFFQLFLFNSAVRS